MPKRVTVSSRRAAVVGAVVVSLMAAGCAKGSEATSSPGTARTATGSGSGWSTAGAGSTVSVADFCNSLDDLNGTAQRVGLDSGLAAVRTDLERSSENAAETLTAGVPHRPGIEPFLGRLASDLRNISAWVDTQATQRDLDADKVPAGVRRSMDDLGYDFRRLQQWADANCKAQQQGDGH